MARSPWPRNPFYPPLVLAGVAFAVTACAFGLLSYLKLRHARGGDGAIDSPLLVFMNAHGATLLAWELAALALATLAAMLTDDYWRRRAESAGSRSNVDAPPAGRST